MSFRNRSIRGFTMLLPLVVIPACAVRDTREDWSVALAYAEVPPNAGAGAATTRLTLSLRSDGQFEASRAVEHPDGTVTGEERRRGVLTTARLEEFATYVLRQNITGLEADHLSLPGGSGTEDGWGGRVTFAEADREVTFTFDSRGVFPMDSRAQAQQRWGLSLVQFLETAAYQLATGSELPPGRALTEAEAVQRALAAMGTEAAALQPRFLRAMQVREMDSGRSTWVVRYSSPIGGPNWSVTLDALSGRVLDARRLPSR